MTVGFFENKLSGFGMTIVGIQENQNSAMLQTFFQIAVCQAMKNKT